LFLIGAMKSGTTYLKDLLAAHPAIFMSSPKEPCHFADPEALRKVWPHAWELGYWRSEERYLSLFATAGEATVIGEASTVYSQVPLFAQVPERILEFNSDARFIYIIRDPVERTISHYWHRVRWWGERRSMASAIRADPRYVDVSDYALQLNAYLSRIARERIYVVTLEQFAEDAGTELGRVYAWLGVDATFAPATWGNADLNVTPSVVDQARGLGVLARLRRSEAYMRLAPNFPKWLRRLGTSLADRPVRPAEVDTSEACAYLRPLQLRQTEELSRLLQRSFPEWRTLYAHPPPAASPPVALDLQRPRSDI
jgi:Sulfotransferase family